MCFVHTDINDNMHMKANMCLCMCHLYHLYLPSRF